VFSTFLETGRVKFLYDPNNPLSSPGGSFVIASIKLDLLSELIWPGKVDIVTGIINVGNSSIRLIQGLYQNEKIAATEDTVVVQIDVKTKPSKPLSQETKNILSHYMLKG